MPKLKFSSNYGGNGNIGMCLSSAHYEERQKLITALEAVVTAAAAPLNLWVNGEYFPLTCQKILKTLYLQAQADGVETFYPEPGKRYGVKINEPDREPRWYTNEPTTFEDATAIEKNYTGAHKIGGIHPIGTRFTVELIQEGEKF